MKRKRTSPIWGIDKDSFSKLIETSTTMSEALAFFGLKNKGSNFRTFQKRCKEDEVDCSKFSGNYGRGRLGPAIPLEKVLVENSTFNRTHLKERLLSGNHLENKCSKCGLAGEWLGQKLVMILDHINGVSDDNRIENLRMLCPNCNSQTATFAGRSKKKHCPMV